MTKSESRDLAMAAIPELVLLDECGEVNPEYPYEACTLSYGHDSPHEHVSGGHGSPKGVVRWAR